jgi:hypothetical protein
MYTFPEGFSLPGQITQHVDLMAMDLFNVVQFM